MTKKLSDKASPLAVKELTHYYKSFVAVDHISFEVPFGSIFGLLGPNGAGKSTTIKMLTTLLPISSGTAKIVGHDVIKEPAKVRQNIGYVPQSLSSDGELTAYENLSLSAKLYGLSREARENRIKELVEFMGLTEYANKVVSTYSGGMIRRLEIAQALVHQPSVLFLDEPSVGLDPAARKALWLLIAEWRRRTDITILLTTHDMDEADRLCDIVCFMHLGRIVAMGSPKELKSAIGENATLDDVFIKYTGTSIIENGEFQNVAQTRRAISDRG